MDMNLSVCLGLRAYEMIEFSVDEDAAGMRLDKYLCRKLNQVPTSHLFKMIRTKKVRVNGKRAQPEQLLASGDRLAIRGRAEELLIPSARPPGLSVGDPAKLEILYEDDWMMAVNKPSGMAVHAGSGIAGATLVDHVRAYLGAKATRNDFTASPAHRLDRDTSGVILVAKRRPAMVHFTRVFTDGKAKKRYLSLVKGRMPHSQGVIDLPLSEHQQTARSKERRGINMQPAVTRYRVLQQAGDVALLEAAIDTGRTHQIRRHLAAIGHPVVGDRRYGDFAFNREAKSRWGLKRLFLHAEAIEVPHPAGGRKIRFRAPLPTDLRQVIERAAPGAP
jgi:23S rRNA pseudouridine955/2504/2580 synthase